MQPEDIKLLKRKIGRAGAAMLGKFKFFDGYLKSLKLHITEDVKITDKACVYTAERKLYFNKKFAQSISGKDIQFILAHEILHIALNHTKRFGQSDIDMQFANVAADLEINQLLRQAKMHVPDSAYLPEHFGLPRDKSAETYYDILKMMNAVMNSSMQSAMSSMSECDEGQGQPQDHNFAEEKNADAEYDSEQVRSDLDNYMKGKKSLSDFNDVKLDKNYDSDNERKPKQKSKHSSDKQPDSGEQEETEDNNSETKEADSGNDEAGEKGNENGDGQGGLEADDKWQSDNGSGSDEQTDNGNEDRNNSSSDGQSGDGAEGDADEGFDGDAAGQGSSQRNDDNNEGDDGADGSDAGSEGNGSQSGDKRTDSGNGDEETEQAVHDDANTDGVAGDSSDADSDELYDDKDGAGDKDAGLDDDDWGDNDDNTDSDGDDGEEEVDTDEDADELNGDANADDGEGESEETMKDLMEGESGAGDSEHSERMESIKVGTAIQHAIELEDDYKSINPHVEITNFLPYAGVYHGLTDYSFMLPNSRMDGVSEDIIFPSMVGGSPHIACCIDVSISMSLYEIMVCLSVVKKLTEEVSSIRLILCNAQPIEIGHVTQHDFDEIISRKLKVGGGTDMTKAMRFLQAEEKYDAVFILSDGETPYGKMEEYSDNIIFYITKPESKRKGFPIPAHVKWRKLWD